MLEENEWLELDSEDLESAFNLFTLPNEWQGYFVYNKPVPAT